LTEIAGLGYRKALEFLTKDYAIHKNPDDKEKIEKQWLMPCLKEYYAGTNTLECAKRAVWLGNDEAHYTRKWEDKDVEDLKVLIQLTVSYIQTELLAEEYIQSMPE